jgi:hypothetical protein
VVKQAQHRQRLEVAGYGGGRRAVEVITGMGPWDEAGTPRVAVLGVGGIT